MRFGTPLDPTSPMLKGKMVEVFPVDALVYIPLSIAMFPSGNRRRNGNPSPKKQHVIGFHGTSVRFNTPVGSDIPSVEGHNNENLSS